jgi:magnesium transporter
LTVTWIHINGIHDVQALEELGNIFGLHPLTLEDILNSDQRPKMEDFCEYIYVVLKAFYSSNHQANEMHSEQISIILGRTFVISFQENEIDIFKLVRERIRAGKGRLRKSGADYLAYALIDSIVDNYFTILEQAGERIEILEESLVKNPLGRNTSGYSKPETRNDFFEKNCLAPAGCQLFQESTDVYLKDIYNHTIQVLDTIESFRDMLSGILDIYLSSISNRMNEIMKVLTIIATVFMPLTFLAGVYAMNFKYMPELEWHWGYFFVWGIMVAIAICMLIYFRRKKWL